MLGTPWKGTCMIQVFGQYIKRVPFYILRNEGVGEGENQHWLCEQANDYYEIPTPNFEKQKSTGGNLITSAECLSFTFHAAMTYANMTNDFA